MKENNCYAPNGEVRHEEDRYGYLKDLDTARLQALLYQESLLIDNDNFDVELVRRISLLLDERDPFFDDFDVEASLQTFREEVIPYIGKYNVESKAEIPGKRRPKRGIKMILIAAVITILLGSMLVTNALGHNIWELVVNWGKETFHIGTGGEVTGGADSPVVSEGAGTVFTGDNTNYKSVEEAATAFSIDVLIPKWIPDGFEFMQANISETSGHRSLILVYQSERRILTYNVDRYDSSEPAYFYEKSDDNGETVMLYGREHYFMTNFDQKSVVWIMSNYIYNIGGDVSKEDLIKILDSIYEGDE